MSTTTPRSFIFTRRILPAALALVSSQYAAAQLAGDLLADKLTVNQVLSANAVNSACGGMLAIRDNPDGLGGEAALIAAGNEKTPTLLARCGEIVHTSRTLADDPRANPSADLGFTVEQLADALQQVAFEETEILGAQATEASSNQTINIGNRLQALRAGITGVSIAGINWNDRGVETGGMAGDDYARWGAFLTGVYGTGERDSSNNVDGFDFDSTGVTAGIDYRFTDSLVAGAAYHLTDSEADIDSNYGETEVEGDSLTVYMTYYQEAFYLEGSVTVGDYDYSTTRNINYHPDTALHEVINGDTSGDEVSWSLGGGYAMHRDALSYTLYAQMVGLDLDIDGYRETSTGVLAMSVDDQSIESLQGIVGVQLNYAISGDFGVVHPYVDVAWHNEFKDGDDTISAFYVNDPNAIQFSLVTDDYDSNYFSINVGATVALAGGTQLFVDYDTVVGLADITSHVFSAGVRVAF